MSMLNPSGSIDGPKRDPMRPSRRSLIIATATVLAVGLGVIVAVGLAGGFHKATTERVSGGGTKVVRVALVDATLGFAVTPDVISVDSGTHLILDVVNHGGAVHDLAVDGGSSRTRMLNPGESQRLDLGMVTHDVHTWCTLPDHKLAGMTLDIRVAGTPATAAHPALDSQRGMHMPSPASA